MSQHGQAIEERPRAEQAGKDKYAAHRHEPMLINRRYFVRTQSPLEEGMRRDAAPVTTPATSMPSVFRPLSMEGEGRGEVREPSNSPGQRQTQAVHPARGEHHRLYARPPAAPPRRHAPCPVSPSTSKTLAGTPRFDVIRAKCRNFSTRHEARRSHPLLMMVVRSR